jgi:hypothetical protein
MKDTPFDFQNTRTKDELQKVGVVTTPFRNLPAELRKLIIETAIQLHPETGFTLLTTSFETHLWARPIVYRHVYVADPNSAESFVAHRRQRTTSILPVKTLCISRRVRPQLAYEILQLCKETKQLAFWAATFDPGLEACFTKITRTIFSLPLTSLSIHIGDCIHGRDPDFSLLPNIKYLTICDSSQDWVNWSWRGISTLTNVTHLSVTDFDGDNIFPAVGRLLEACTPGLEVCVLKLFGPDYERWTADPPMEMGEKFVMQVYSDVAADWARHVRGEDDGWVRAQQIVTGRKDE